MSRYVAGTYNAECDICGFVYKRSEMLKTWDNKLVCRTDYEPKHPQLTIRVRAERQSVSDARPDDMVVDDVGIQGASEFAIVNYGSTEYEVPRTVKGSVNYFVGRMLQDLLGNNWEMFKSRLARGLF